jgi:hypothetical protein
MVVDGGLLDCNAVWICRQIPTSTLQMETVYFSETLVYTYKFTRRYNPENQHRHFHRHENLISHLYVFDSYVI